MSAAPEFGVVERILDGELDESQAVAQGLLSSEERERLHELQALEVRLQREADAYNAYLSAPEPVSRGPWGFIALLAAAASLLVLFLVDRGGSDEPFLQNDTLLGGTPVQALAPVGAGVGAYIFSLECTAQGPLRTTVRVWAADDPSGSAPRLEHTFDGRSWDPGTHAGILTDIPPEIRWEAVVYGPSGDPIGAVEVPFATL